MSQTAAARSSQASAPSLRDRLKDPSLLRDRCYIDGAWVGTPGRPVTNPVNSHDHLPLRQELPPAQLDAPGCAVLGRQALDTASSSRPGLS